MSEGPQPEPTTSDRAGTAAIIAGTAVSAVAVYLYQVIAGRSLGAEEFAPVGIMWTTSFLVFTVLNLPVEQYLTRRLTLAGGRWVPDRHAALTAAVPLAAGVVVGTGFVAATLDRFFSGSVAFIAVAAALLVSRSALSIGRAFLAGRRRFLAFGVITALEGVALVALAAGVALYDPSTLAFVAILVLAPLVVLLARPLATTVDMPVLASDIPAGSGFLVALVVATAASQIILAAEPVVVGFIGGTATAVSVVFVTFTLFRGPVTSSYNLIARVLPDFTVIAASGDDHRLDVWAERIGLAGLAAGGVFGISGWFLGPVVVETLYGAEFAPSAPVAGLAAAAVGFALASLFLNQIFVARGETGRLAGIWLLALVGFVVALMVSSGDPMGRVAVAFLVGEAAALALLVLVSVLARHRGSGADYPPAGRPIEE
jgi:O-antigen/teichoic acid export membrane protein